MATFGDLVVRLGLDKRGFDRGIGGMRGSLATLRSVAVPAAAGIAAVGAAAGAAALAFKNFVGPAFESIDRLGDMSARLGVATDKLGALQHAAQLAGVEQESLATGITKYLDTLSNATAGTKSAVSAFSGLGLKAGDLKGLALDKQFVAVANALQRIENPADRVRIAIDLFGKSGAQMLQLFNDGGQSLIATLEEAKRLGIAPDAAAVAKVQAANDAIDKMHAAWKGIANTIAVEIAPMMENWAGGIQRAVPDIVSGISSMNSGMKRFLATTVSVSEVLKLMGSGQIFHPTKVGRMFAFIYKNTLNALNAGSGVGGMKPPKIKGPPGESAPGRPPAQGIGGGMGGLFLKPGMIGKGLSSGIGGGGGLGNTVAGTRRDVTNNVAGGAFKGSAEALGRILRAGARTKDPNTPHLKAIEKYGKATAEALKRQAEGGTGLIVGAGGAGT